MSERKPFTVAHLAKALSKPEKLFGKGEVDQGKKSIDLLEQIITTLDSNLCSALIKPEKLLDEADSFGPIISDTKALFSLVINTLSESKPDEVPRGIALALMVVYLQEGLLQYMDDPYGLFEKELADLTIDDLLGEDVRKILDGDMSKIEHVNFSKGVKKD